MSDIIRLLPDHIANQIAAGEVVQRPASAIKELMENCIDAGATKIEVHIKDAGRTLIQVIDNGKGMSFTDARMAFERHATSKISNANDLFNLQTKGFRGEALASIAAIAHVRLQTRREEDELGSSLTIEGSKISSQDAVQCAKGANFEVKNLFYNVPARRNFLKSDNAEFRHILTEFERVALVHPEIHFKLTHNGSETYNLIASPLRKRIVDIMGKQYSDKLVPITEKMDIVNVEGFIVKPDLAKKSPGDQYFFVNNRFFKDSYFHHAVKVAFEQVLPPSHYPGYFLYLTVDPKNIDVNVHPTKTEIKFEEDKSIYAILKTAVRVGLGKFNIMPSIDFDHETVFDIPYDMKKEEPKVPTIEVDPSFNPFTSFTQNSTPKSSSSSSGKISVSGFDYKSHESAMNSKGFGNVPSKANLEHFWQMEIEENNDVKQESLFESNEIPEGPFLTNASYLIAVSTNGLLLIHARRAKERILYNELMEKFMTTAIPCQQLLFPLEKNFSKQDALVWTENDKVLRRMGFDYEIINEVLNLKGIPSVLNESTIISSVDSILEQLQNGEIDKGEVAHVVVKNLAFSGSMSFKIPQDNESQKSLVEQLYEQDEMQFSPNGKKIFALIDNTNIFNLF